MRLHSLRLRNFRSFRDETITFEPGTVLVGANNAGKTTVVDALAFLLKGWEPEIADWGYFGVCPQGRRDAEPLPPVVVVGRFGDLTEAESDYWALALADDGTFALGAVALGDDYTPRSGVRLSEMPNPFALVDPGRIPVDFPRDDEGAAWGVGYVDEVTGGAAWIDPVSFWRYCGPHVGPMSMGPTLIAIPGPASSPPTIRDVLQPLIVSLLDAEAGGGKGLVQRLEMRAEDVEEELADHVQDAISLLGELGVQSIARGRSVGPQAEEWTSSLVGFRLRGIDERSAFGAGQPGAGATRAAALAALQLYCRPTLWPSDRRPVILAVEEPEAGLHPALQRQVATTMRDLPSRGVQTIITTHSSMFIDAASPDGIRVIHQASASPRISARGDVAAIVAQLGTRPADVLLGEHFLVVEGKGDLLVIQAWARTLGIDLERAGIRVVPADGADAVHVQARLAAIAFPGALFTALFDGDEKGLAAAARMRRSAVDIEVVTWSLESIECYYPARAVNLWARYASLRSGSLPPAPVEGMIDIHVLNDLEVNISGAKRFDKVGGGAFIASEMTRREMDAEILALFARVLRRRTTN